ncbi:hypothetical protein B0H16DRAFT_1455949 [Mycena metata]|uniref:Uncharacterized protein n=1 Tax=Mycena metata TaxID=1033252 RepID=A0AAD7NI50_9AGAR|nr:hypothetical protein B0H16DRAFT_1455949 [Mycena metata]
MAVENPERPKRPELRRGHGKAVSKDIQRQNRKGQALVRRVSFSLTFISRAPANVPAMLTYARGEALRPRARDYPTTTPTPLAERTSVGCHVGFWCSRLGEPVNVEMRASPLWNTATCTFWTMISVARTGNGYGTLKLCAHSQCRARKPRGRQSYTHSHSHSTQAVVVRNCRRIPAFSRVHLTAPLSSFGLLQAPRPGCIYIYSSLTLYPPALHARHAYASASTTSIDIKGKDKSESRICALAPQPPANHTLDELTLDPKEYPSFHPSTRQCQPIAALSDGGVRPQDPVGEGTGVRGFREIRTGKEDVPSALCSSRSPRRFEIRHHAPCYAYAARRSTMANVPSRTLQVTFSPSCRLVPARLLLVLYASDPPRLHGPRLDRDIDPHLRALPSACAPYASPPFHSRSFTVNFNSNPTRMERLRTHPDPSFVTVFYHPPVRAPALQLHFVPNAAAGAARADVDIQSFPAAWVRVIATCNLPFLLDPTDHSFTLCIHTRCEHGVYPLCARACYFAGSDSDSVVRRSGAYLVDGVNHDVEGGFDAGGDVEVGESRVGRGCLDRSRSGTLVTPAWPRFGDPRASFAATLVLEMPGPLGLGLCHITDPEHLSSRRRACVRIPPLSSRVSSAPRCSWTPKCFARLVGILGASALILAEHISRNYCWADS